MSLGPSVSQHCCAAVCTARRSARRSAAARRALAAALICSRSAVPAQRNARELLTRAALPARLLPSMAHAWALLQHE